MEGLYAPSIVPMPVYIDDPCDEPSLSSGAVCDLLQSPNHCWTRHPRLGAAGSEQSKTADIGSLMHALLFEDGGASIRVIDPTDYRSRPTKDNPDGSIPEGWTNAAIRTVRDECYSQGLTPVLKADYDTARIAAEIAKRFLDSSPDLPPGILTSGNSEMTMIWTESDGKDRIWCRARPDLLDLQAGVMLHYKTTKRSAQPESFERALSPLGYDISVAWYRRGLHALNLVREREANEFLHLILVQEQAPPFACSIIGLDPVKIALAEERIEEAVALWRRWKDKPAPWPAYSNRIHWSTPTAFELAKGEARRSNDEGWLE